MVAHVRDRLHRDHARPFPGAWADRAFRHDPAGPDQLDAQQEDPDRTA